MEKSKLEMATLKKDDHGHYLRLVYLVEDDKTINRVIYPKVRLFIPDNPTVNHTRSIIGSYFDDQPTIRLTGDIELPLEAVTDYKYSNGQKVYAIEHIVETKTKEMTIEEIEKALGHKVKIIGEEK